MDIADIRLNNLRLVIDQLVEQGFKTRKDQAQRLGDCMSSSYLSQLLSGKPIGREVARKISLVMERDAGWMDRPHTPTPEANSTVLAHEMTPGYLRLELYEGAAGMGTGVVNQDFPEVIRTLEVAEWEVRRKLGFLPKPGRIQLITGRGPSMRPKIEDGDVVWIDTAVDYFDGDDYYLINVDGETSIKMLQRRSDGLYVVSVNPEFPAWKPETGALRVQGRALIHAGFRRF
ncbi:S24 family peptidase [Xanthomonas oryzae]|uniref:S24 family peptidase n=1 Tax=Xanthomonas oryzae TaxID=347 RepID=UPI000415EC8E|nr:S24 family peptidase [Xanthomonas oryzae]AVU01206.1 helix-turn-helix transcriptional regulator [Xanthomonas oryzae pv. oryzae]QBN29825.1 helix-turn-helix transcriptional regulator [Xanthomonas oryzae pv. oryzae]QBN62570.1 helix-turn-helix transcriptional regulator [Xanthomonas oryzae pv. oryzae]QBN66214.1 helix-turn-helix transcriptional regulator [Xanthomonas oryzae pv. oryzae]